MVGRLLFVAKFKKYIYSHSTKYICRNYFTSSNCIFMQLQGVVFIQLQGNDIVVNFQGNISIQRRYIYSQKNIYSFREIIIVQGIILISRKLYSRKLYSFKELSSFKENKFIQGNYIHSSLRKYVHSRKQYSFNNVAFPDRAEIFIQ